MELDFHLPKQMSPESDTETTDNAPPPLLRTHLSNALSLSATHKPHHHYNRPQNAAVLAPTDVKFSTVSYKECLKNHAAKMGGLALDGCGEFMPSLDPLSSLKCAACGCHRNFHRRAHPSPTPPPPLLLWSPNSSSSGPNSPTTTSSPTPYSAAFPTKRARTKFTPEQKAKMHGFADRLGWRMARGPAEEKMLEEFCGEVGVRRNVFKVWMHNNKQRKGIIGNSEIDVNIKDEQQLAVERKVFGGSISSPSSS